MAGNVLKILFSCFTMKYTLFLNVLIVFVGLNNSQTTQPNIVLILADDYGWHDIGYHGSEIKTPNLDLLAGQGVKLENYYVQPICTPTRSQLLSGRYQIHTGLQHGVIRPSVPNALPSHFETIADRLKGVGYSTHIVGKWHLGFHQVKYTPTKRGFDSYYGYLTGSEDYYTHSRCYSFGKKRGCGVDLHDNMEVDRQQKGKYSASLFATRAQKLIESHDNSKPLFMYVPFQSVHAPLEVPAKYVDQYAHIKDKNRRTYAGMVTCMDEAIGNITDSLKQKGIWDNTILIFSTDNGGQILRGGSNYPLRGWKGSLWEGGVHGVGFVHSPFLKNKGTVSKELIHVTDWYPTIVGLAGGKIPTNLSIPLDGHDVWATISMNKSSPRKELLHNIDPLTHPSGEPRANSTFDTRKRAALRSGRWKIITGDPGNGSWIPVPKATTFSIETNSIPHYLDTEMVPEDAYTTYGDPKKNLWLFDIENDPNEHHDLSDDRPDIVDALLKRLAAYDASAVPCRYPKADPKANPELHGGAWVPWE